MIVLKIGGGASVAHREILEDVYAQMQRGESFVIVHGANHALRELCQQLDHPVRTLTSVSGHQSRYTDPRTMELFTMAYCGQVNTQLVALAHDIGINAVGLSGLDGGLLRAERKQALRVVEDGRRRVIRDDLSGRISDVNVDLLDTLLERGYTPLISPPALSEENQAVNVDGDRAAARIAAALQADRLVILSDVPGLLRDPQQEESLVPRIPRAEFEVYEEYAAGRMKKKLLGAREALEQGVGEVILADGRTSRPVTGALARQGTCIA